MMSDGEDDVEEITQREVLKAFGVLSGEHSVGTGVEIRGVTLEKMEDGEWWTVYSDDGEIADIVDFSTMSQAQDLIYWCFQYRRDWEYDDTDEPEPLKRERRGVQ
jgi:hypothetical protein